MPTPLEIRIKKIQKKIGVTQTGIYDSETCNALEKLIGGLATDLTLFEKKKNIQKLLGFTGKDIDGIFGVNTTTKIEFFLDERLPDLPSGANMIVSKKSLDIIVESEVSSKSAYNSKYKFPIWPKGNSGITIGIGYDIGTVSLAKFTQDWQGIIPQNDFDKLKKLVGVMGNKAEKLLTASIKSIEIPYATALEVFYTKSLPDFGKLTAGIYPGIELLPPDAQGAILSLVYNRGTKLTGDSRVEMKNIQGYVASKNLSKIANEIRKMKRLWPDLRGLVIRREKEAVLVENAKYFMKSQDYIFV